MPLTRGKGLGYNTDRMSFEFTMMNGTEIVDCQISSAAMDEIAGARGTRPDQREVQFLSLRDTIERIASSLFDKESTTPGRATRLFYHHARYRDQY